MYRYAVCFEEGLGVKPDKAAATLWYKNAARAGHVPAGKWCRENGVVLDPPKPSSTE